MGNQQTCCGINLNSDNQKQIELSSKVYVLPQPTIPSSENLQLQKNQSRVQPEVPQIIELPLLNPEVQQVYDRQKPFEEEFSQQLNKQRIKIQLDVYYGPLDQTGKPTKLGKLYKTNGALLIAMFTNGIAQGPCFYIMNNGSYYKGQMKDNIATCKQGQFVSKSLHYRGGFENNLFHGKGEETSPSKNYSFKGEYQYGRKKQGTMKWRQNGQEYEYTGAFNQKGQFHRNGLYTNAQGTYKGDFQNGKKQGYGVFQYKSKLRYQGYYTDNKKHGQGQIINCDGTIAYKGTFENGMPHGKGIATSKSGQQFEAYWNNGIDKRHINQE